LPFEEYARGLVAAANIQCLLLDEGYPPPDEAYSTGEMASMLGVTVRPMLRIETLVQDLLVRHGTLSDVVDAFDQTLSSLRERGYVALKSIAAYRTGLQIDPPSQPDVARAFGEARDVAVRQGTVRIAWKPLNDFFVLRGLYIAAETGLPVQFHTGYGDPDLDLRLANPLHLRSLFEAPALQDVPIVLLHESYPFTAEAAFLAASYPNAYVDIAYSLPPLDLLELNRVTALVLGSAPASKVMVSSDGTRIPEHYWLGAVRARSAVQTVLGEMVATGEIDTDDAESLGRMVLNENALRLYGLTPTPAQADSISPSDGQ
jgi:hypothetical protein